MNWFQVGFIKCNIVSNVLNPSYQPQNVETADGKQDKNKTNLTTTINVFIVNTRFKKTCSVDQLIMISMIGVKRLYCGKKIIFWTHKM